jgi:hypothetical protein
MPFSLLRLMRSGEGTQLPPLAGELLRLVRDTTGPAGVAEVVTALAPVLARPAADLTAIALDDPRTPSRTGRPRSPSVQADRR